MVLDDIGRETYTDKQKENVFRIIDTLMNYKIVTAFAANLEMIIKFKAIPELNAAFNNWWTWQYGCRTYSRIIEAL